MSTIKVTDFATDIELLSAVFSAMSADLEESSNLHLQRAPSYNPRPGFGGVAVPDTSVMNPASQRNSHLGQSVHIGPATYGAKNNHGIHHTGEVFRPSSQTAPTSSNVVNHGNSPYQPQPASSGQGHGGGFANSLSNRPDSPFTGPAPSSAPAGHFGSQAPPLASSANHTIPGGPSAQGVAALPAQPPAKLKRKADDDEDINDDRSKKTMAQKSTNESLAPRPMATMKDTKKYIAKESDNNNTPLNPFASIAASAKIPASDVGWHYQPPTALPNPPPVTSKRKADEDADKPDDESTSKKPMMQSASNVEVSMSLSGLNQPPQRSANLPPKAGKRPSGPAWSQARKDDIKFRLTRLPPGSDGRKDIVRKIVTKNYNTWIGSNVQVIEERKKFKKRLLEDPSADWETGVINEQTFNEIQGLLLLAEIKLGLA